MKCPRCQQENPPQAKFCLDCATPLRLPPDSDGEALNVARRLTEALRREQEAREQQAATSDILRVISNSPSDAQPVFDAIVASAVRVCDARFGLLYRWDGENLYGVASHGATPAMEQIFRRGARPAPSLLRAHGPWRPLHILDIRESEPYRSGWAVWRDAIDAETVRTILVVPLVKAARYLGCIMIYRREIRAFTERQVELLTTFADQAVIAIENVRLFTELQQKNEALTQAHAQVSEALEQQTATSAILRVISSSPTDIQPVFDTIIERAVRLCDARLGALLRFDGQMIHLAAHAQQVDAESVQALETMYPTAASSANVTGRALLSGRPVHVRDMREDPELAQAPTAQVGHRTVLSVPMMREGAPIGAITVARAHVEPFSDAQIELLKTFADQAVIAIENVRLFKELEARTQDLTRSVGELRALGEVGQAISSTLDLETVLTTIVSRAVQLSGLDGGVVFEYDEPAEE